MAVDLNKLVINQMLRSFAHQYGCENVTYAKIDCNLEAKKYKAFFRHSRGTDNKTEPLTDDLANRFMPLANMAKEKANLAELTRVILELQQDSAHMKAECFGKDADGKLIREKVVLDD